MLARSARSEDRSSPGWRCLCPEAEKLKGPAPCVRELGAGLGAMGPVKESPPVFIQLF